MPELPTLARLLSAHGLAGVPEHRIENAGYSGAALSRLVRHDGMPFVLKRMSIDRDWIMRATDDVACRETAFAASQVPLPELVRVPTVGAARDGDGYALLMHDITRELLPPGLITADQLEVIVRGMAALHRSALPARDAAPWCDLRKRLTLLTPATARLAESYGAGVARDLFAGWALFEKYASPRALAMIQHLAADATPLLAALSQLPDAFLHGDMKLDNIGIDGTGRIWLIDWAMTLLAPPAVELGWFLAINSRRLSVSPDDVMSMYAAVAVVPTAQRARHDGLTVVCGLLLRGWRKALDAAEGEPDELHWWCERVEAAERFL